MVVFISSTASTTSSNTSNSSSSTKATNRIAGGGGVGGGQEPKKKNKEDLVRLPLQTFPPSYQLNEYDVLCGRMDDRAAASSATSSGGERRSRYPGNHRFRQHVGEWCMDYVSKTPELSLFEKQGIITLIFNRVRSNGGRFLKPQKDADGDLRQITDREVREKIAHALRDAGYQNQKKQQDEEEGRVEEQAAQARKQLLKHSGTEYVSVLFSFPEGETFDISRKGSSPWEVLDATSAGDKNKTEETSASSLGARGAGVESSPNEELVTHQKFPPRRVPVGRGDDEYEIKEEHQNEQEEELLTVRKKRRLQQHESISNKPSTTYKPKRRRRDITNDGDRYPLHLDPTASAPAARSQHQPYFLAPCNTAIMVQQQVQERPRPPARVQLTPQQEDCRSGTLEETSSSFFARTAPLPGGTKHQHHQERILPPPAVPPTTILATALLPALEDGVWEEERRTATRYGGGAHGRGRGRAGILSARVLEQEELVPAAAQHQHQEQHHHQQWTIAMMEEMQREQQEMRNLINSHSSSSFPRRREEGTKTTSLPPPSSYYYNHYRNVPIPVQSHATNKSTTTIVRPSHPLSLRNMTTNKTSWNKNNVNKSVSSPDVIFGDLYPAAPESEKGQLAFGATERDEEEEDERISCWLV